MKRTIGFMAAFLMAAALSTGCLAADKTDLVIAVDADIETLHATDYSTTIELNILNQIYDTLMYINPDGTHEPEPRIAESAEISEDGLDYTFHLRNDVTFQDGTLLTAEDVVFSLETYFNSEYQGSKISMMTGVEALDDYTVVAHLDTPYAPFLDALCLGHIASKAYFEADPEGFANAPIGSGPYRFVSRANGSNVVLEAYDDYYRGAPSIKKLTFMVIPDVATEAIALQTGEVNFAEIDSSVLAQLEANPQITVDRAATSVFSYLCMNHEKAPFDNVLVRQAVNYAINRENLVAVCFDGEAEVNSNICAKDRVGYSDSQLQYTYDPEKAKELLTEAGIETPYNLGEMLVAEKYENLAVVLQNDLKAVGLETTISVKEFNSYIGDLVEGNYLLSPLNMTLEGDTQELQMAFMTEYIGMANNARYSDEEMNQLFNDARVETNAEARLELFDKAFSKAQNEAIYAVLCNPTTLYAFNADLVCPEFPFEGEYYVYDFQWAE